MNFLENLILFLPTMIFAYNVSDGLAVIGSGVTGRVYARNYPRLRPCAALIFGMFGFLLVGAAGSIIHGVIRSCSVRSFCRAHFVRLIGGGRWPYFLAA